MAEKKITRKVISKGKVEAENLKSDDSQKPEAARMAETGRTKKTCFFCQSKTSPSYTDTNILRRFITDRAKIVARAKSNVCSKHQRLVSKQIKYARHLSLLLFAPKV